LVEQLIAYVGTEGHSVGSARCMSLEISAEAGGLDWKRGTQRALPVMLRCMSQALAHLQSHRRRPRRPVSDVNCRRNYHNHATSAWRISSLSVANQDVRFW